MNILDFTYDKFLDGDCVLLDAHNHIKHSLEFKSLCFGLLPSGYPIDKEFESDDIKIGLGFHPWAARDEVAKELKIFEEYFADADFVGEIGLDFSAKHQESKEIQLSNFEEICKMLRECKNKVISLHAVNASGEVMDMIDKKVLENNVVIFHWFSGSSEELKRALDSGYYFSVGPKMLATNKGHEYIRQIPEDRMFIETDLPWDGEEITPEQHLNLLNDFAMQLREVKSY